MTRYTLKDDGYPTFKKIVTGRKWIGRVCKTEKGYYLGIIGPTMVKHPTERGAFDSVVAKHCGFEEPADMDQHNRVVGARNRVRRAKVKQVADAMIQGNFEPFGRLLDELGPGPFKKEGQ